MRKEYDIGGQKFWQDKLVLGQIEHLAKRLQHVGEFKMTVPGIVDLVTKRYDVLACVLIPNGHTRAEHIARLDEGQMQEEEAHLRSELDWEATVLVVTDFFDCNPISSLSNAVLNLTKKMESVGPLLNPSTRNSKPSTSSSPEVGSVTEPSSVPPLPMSKPVHG